MKFIQEYQNVRLSGQIYFKTCELIELLSKTWWGDRIIVKKFENIYIFIYWDNKKKYNKY